MRDKENVPFLINVANLVICFYTYYGIDTLNVTIEHTINMKLKHFTGTNIREYLNYNISFRENVTFLIGMNGSGKTTVLKLITGLLTPSYWLLTQISFTKIVLECDNGIILEATQENKKLHLKVSLSGQIIDNEIDIVEYGIESDIPRQFEELIVCKTIKNLKSPLFLELNRHIRHNYIGDNDDREMIFYRSRRIHKQQMLLNNNDTINHVLFEIQEILNKLIRETTKIQYESSETFKRKVFIESFKINKDYGVIANKRNNHKEELKNLPARKDNLIVAVKKLGFGDLQKEYSEFFTNAEKTLRILVNASSKMRENNEDNMQELMSALANWIFVSAQLDMVDKVIQYANEYYQEIQNIKEPIIRFQNSINSFFVETGKEIKIEESGDIKVYIKNALKENSIYDLSSGEKQIVIMLAHLALYKQFDNAPIFIIDEPEVSLHIAWQEIFVDTLLQAAPDMQFILATHAPAIISKTERKEWCEDLSKMN